MLNWVGWGRVGGVRGCLYFYHEVLSAAGRCRLPAPLWMKYELQCQLNLSQTRWDELMIREQRCVLMCRLCDVGGGIITHCTPAETEQTTDGWEMKGYIHTDDSALLMCHFFFFFQTRKILQLVAHRGYFPRMNFKRLLPLPLKASCSLRLRFMLFIQMKKTHFSFKRPSFSDVLKKGLERLWKNDGMSVAFHHSSTSPATERDLRSLFQGWFGQRWLELINACSPTGKKCFFKVLPIYFLSFCLLICIVLLFQIAPEANVPCGISQPPPPP